MTTRFDKARSIFDQRAFFKIVCGAGNEDPVEIRRLVTIYTLAGAAGIDISANPDIVKSAVDGINRADALAKKWGRPAPCRPFITVSVGLAGDPHVRKGRINPDLCIRCGQCIPLCEQDAITEEYSIIEERCIGCGKCADICEQSAIKFFDRKRDLTTLLPECLAAGAEMVELHAVTLDDEGVISDWSTICSVLKDNYVSMCLDRSLLSDKHLTSRIREAYALAPDRMILQADGAPMSGGSDDFHTTLQAVATADIVAKSGIPVKILASGGTNSRTRELAEICGVSIHGVSIGTFARKIIKSRISDTAFDTDDRVIAEAVKTAEKLVRVSSPDQQ